MAKLTLTEALAELETIDKRIRKKREFVLLYLTRPEDRRDPLEKKDNGGSPTLIAQELQSIGDLQERKISLRRAIAAANATNNLSIEGITRAIADWITWRRDISAEESAALGNMRGTIERARKEAQAPARSGINYGAQAVVGDGKGTDIVVNYPETTLASKSEQLENILGQLNGKLSLANATILIDID